MDTFEKLKSNGMTSFAMLQQEMLRLSRIARSDDLSGAWEVRDRAVDALDSVGNFELARAIEGCRAGSVCGSLWCPDCRLRTVETFHSSVAEDCWKNDWGNDDLLHVTAHLGVCPVDADAVLKMIADDDRVWRRLRTRSDGLWVRAVYEFELVSMKALMRSSSSDNIVKKKQMKQLWDASPFELDDLVLYVHWHGLANQHPADWLKSDYHVVGSDGRLERTFRSNECGVFVQRLRQDQSFEKNLTKINSYPFKNPVRFKHSFVGSDHLSGEKMIDEELGRLIGLMQVVQGRQKRRLFRSIG